MLSRKDYKRFIQGHLIGWVQLHHLHVWLMFMDVYGQILFNVDQMLCMKKAAWKHVPVEIVAPKRQGHPNFGCLVGASPKIPQQIWFGFEVKLPKCLEFFDCSQFFENVSWKFTIRFRFRCPLWASSQPKVYGMLRLQRVQHHLVFVDAWRHDKTCAFLSTLQALRHEWHQTKDITVNCDHTNQ